MAISTGSKALLQRNKFTSCFKLLCILLLVFVMNGKSCGQLYWNTNGTSATWTSANWGSTSSGPFTNGWTSGSAVVFTANSNVTFATTTVDNVTIDDGLTVTVAKAGTLTFNGGAVKTWTIGTGSTLTWQSQSVTANSTAGITKNGAGTLDLGAMTFTTNMTGGFTLNNGTVTVTGNKALGNGALNLNGGTLNSTGGIQFTPTSIVIGGDFTLSGTGNASWDAATTIALGASTRIITNSTTGGSRTFSGVISGITGSGLTLNGSSSYPISLTGNNTYDGLTTINGSLLILNASGGAIKSGNAVTIGGGTLEVAQSQTLGNFTMTSGTLKVDAGQTLTITGTYIVSGGTINNQGTIILKGNSAQTFPGSSTVINNGTSGLMSNLIIDNSYGVSFDNSFSISTLTLNPNAKLTNNSGKTLTISTLNINSDSSGTGTFIDNGTTNVTTSNVQQFLTGGRNWYLSSPVSGSNATTVLASSTATVKPSSFIWYDETKGSTTPWTTESSTLTVGKGYIVTNPASPNTPSTDGIITFSGTLNSGNYSTTIQNPLTLSNTGVKDGFNLVGNPYPSYLDWNQVTKTNLNPTMWYRTNEGGTYKFYTYNGTSAGYGGGQIGVPANVSNLIPPIQAFWVRVEGGAGSMAFNNNMRSHSQGTNPLKAPSTTKSVQQLLRLQVSNGLNTDEAVIYFNPNASNGYDAFDSPKMVNNHVEIPEIYTMANNSSEQLVINGMNSLPTDTEIPLGFITKTAGSSFSIKANEISNLDSNRRVILKDIQNPNPIDLTDGSVYSFSSDITSGTGRFSIIFKTILNATRVDSNKSQQIVISKNVNNQISVNCVGNLNSESSVTVYNTIGQKLIFNQLKNNHTLIDVPNSTGVYVVKVVIGEEKITQKVILN